MAWNPSPEVQVARDAARTLLANTAIVIWTTTDGHIGMASYGQTKSLCDEAGKCGGRLYAAAMKFWSADD